MFEHKLNEYPEFIDKKVTKLFSDMTESKISEIEKKHSDVLHWIQGNVNNINSDLSGFKEFVNPSFKSLDTETKKTKKQLDKLIQEVNTVKSIKEDIRKTVSKNISEDFKTKLNSISSEISVLNNNLKEVSDRLDYFDKKIADLDTQRNEFLEILGQQTTTINSIKGMTKTELDKKLAADRAKYEEILKNIMSEKRSLEEMMKRQKEKVVTYLKELKTK